MERRTFLTGSTVAGLSLVDTAHAQYLPPTTQPLALGEIGGAAARLRAQFTAQFDAEYVERVILPHFLNSVYADARLALPMIDVILTKENALPFDLWGLLSETWEPAPEEGVTVFLQGLEKRGPDNLRKKIYFSALTPDLYGPKYRGKVKAFWDKLLAPGNAGKPLMRPYLESYFDLYWDLHLGVRGDQIPAQVHAIGQAFNTVLAYRNPTDKIVYENYMIVRKNLAFLKSWIDRTLSDLKAGNIADPDKTFAHYWIKNAGNGDHFAPKDVVFEVFHNFVALSQWGNSLYNIMLKLADGAGDAQVKAKFKTTMENAPDDRGDKPFSPLERFVMELFRVIVPNGGSISAIKEVRPPPFERHGYAVTPHGVTPFDRVHWQNPEAFDPDRYLTAPLSSDIDEAACTRLGFAKCPFDRKGFDVADGRKATMHNSGFGTAYGIVDGQPLPVCDSAGFAPFGFGYRRCPGEQLTINVFEDLLRKVWQDRIQFEKLAVANPEPLPIGPTTVIADDLGFRRV